METLLDNIERYVRLEEAEAKALADIARPLRVRKRQFIVQPGFVCSSQTYVVEGVLRAYFITEEGQEHTLQFAIDDWFISDFNSYLTQQPASLFVEALEDASLIQFPYEKVEELCRTYPCFERFFRIVAQKSFAFAQRRILSNLGKSAEERYLEFLAMYPEIVRRVPQYTLASYLGMSAEFLSKIRKKLSR